MSDYTRTEISVGLFVLGGIAALAYLSLSVSGLELRPRHFYSIEARFASVGDLRKGAGVKIAGVSVGKVEAIRLKEYAAETVLEMDAEVRLPVDTIASIRTAGLLGDTYVSLSPGGSERLLVSGERIAQTEPAIDLYDLISKYAFGSPLGGEPRDQKKNATPNRFVPTGRPDRDRKTNQPLSVPLE